MKKIGSSIKFLLEAGILILVVAFLVFSINLLRQRGGEPGAQVEPVSTEYPPPATYPAPVETEFPPMAVYPPPDETKTVDPSRIYRLNPPGITPEPTPTSPPVPTLHPTPVHTPVPLAVPPFVSIQANPDRATYIVSHDNAGNLTIIDSTQAEKRVIPAAEVVSVLRPESGDNWGDISPDGRKLVLSFGHIGPSGRSMVEESLQILDLDTGQWKQIADQGYDPLWSPDGRHIVYQARGRKLIAYSLETGSSFPVCPTISQAGDLISYDWSPDGNRLAVIHVMSTTPSSIVVVRLDAPDDCWELVPAKESIWSSSPIWSPDGKWLLYYSSSSIRSPEGYYFIDLWVVSVDGDENHPLTQQMIITSAAWSPDSQWITYSGIKPFEQESLSYDLWITDLYGSSLIRLTQNAKQITQISWANDGVNIYFVNVLNQLIKLSLINGDQEPILVAVDDLVIYR
jgi:Tol biopolymer transport system component